MGLFVGLYFDTRPTRIVVCNYTRCGAGTAWIMKNISPVRERLNSNPEYTWVWYMDFFFGLWSGSKLWTAWPCCLSLSLSLSLSSDPFSSSTQISAAAILALIQFISLFISLVRTLSLSLSLSLCISIYADEYWEGKNRITSKEVKFLGF